MSEPRIWDAGSPVPEITRQPQPPLLPDLPAFATGPPASSLASLALASSCGTCASSPPPELLPEPEPLSASPPLPESAVVPESTGLPESSVLPESATPPLELELLLELLDELELLLELELDELELLLELDELELLLELELELDELELLLELDELELALTLKSGVSSASALAIGVKLRVPGGRRASGARTTAIHQPLNFMGVSLRAELSSGIFAGPRARSKRFPRSRAAG